MKYRKKPVVIDAEQFVIWDLEKSPSSIELLGVIYPVYFENKKPYVLIPTLEGNMKAENLDWIIKGVKGEFYPCKPEIFEQTYEKVNI